MEKKHILIVDDEATLLMTYRLILEMQGYRSSSAINSLEAKVILASDTVDLLLCDLTLGPGDSGTGLIEHARSILPVLPCALATGYNTQELDAWATQFDVTLLQKPVPIRALLQIVSALLRDERRKSA